MQRRIYLDQAATSWPKLTAALDAADHFVRHCGATSGRGAYSSAQVAQQWVQQARHHLARLLGAKDAGDVAFCSSGTHALNAAIFGWLRSGDGVLTTQIEHNSVLRPLHHLQLNQGIKLQIASANESGFVDCQSAEPLINSSTRWVILGHASNVTGCMQEIRAWGELAHRQGAYLMVDASQSLGYVPINMQELGIDVLVAAGHKGLRALPGSGLIVANQALREQLQPLMFGGTGIASESLDATSTWPHSIELGNLNLPAVVSMAVAAEHLLGWHPEQWQAWREPLNHFLAEMRLRVPAEQVRIIGHDDHHDWLPVISLLPTNWGIHEVAAVLDANFGIEARAGFHCAALVHRALGSDQLGGTLRLSLGHDCSRVDLDDCLHALSSVFSC